jgi:hypothetical protein
MGRGILTLAVATCAAVTTAAHGADLTIFYPFSAAGAGQVENPHVRGSAILVTDDVLGVTHCIMTVSGLQPNTLYGVRIGTVDTGTSNAQAFTTGSFGRGAFSVDVPGFITADMNPEYLIYRWDGEFDDPNSPEPDFDLIWDVTPSELRAEGNLLQLF